MYQGKMLHLSHASEISPPLVQSSLTWDFLHRNFNTPRASTESEGYPGITCIALIGSTFGLPATVAIALLLICPKVTNYLQLRNN